MSRRRITIVTLGILLSLFMASMESTVVSTAMPTIVRERGGLELYSWVFACSVREPHPQSHPHYAASR